MKEAEVQLRNLADHISHIQTATYEVAQRGKFKLPQIQKSCENVMNHYYLDTISRDFLNEFVN